MTELGRGVKAGVLLGVIYGPIWWISVLIVSSTYSNPFNIPIDLLVWASVRSAGAFAIYGLVIGLLLAVVYEKLPSKSSVLKGGILSLIFFSIFALTIDLIFATGSTMNYVEFLKNILLLIPFGFILGYFWNLFGSDEV